MTTHFLQPDKAYLFQVGQPPVEVVPTNERDFQLKQLYELLECDMVQVIQIATGHYMILDEESKYTKAVNDSATALACTVLMPGDYIAGAALICPPSMFL